MSMRSSGFTIIETVLFLGVSGMLAVAILAGSSVAIAQQRYRDAATTLQTFIQTQYNDTSNVINDRNNKWQCDADAVVTEKETDGPIAGASDCVILGKVIQIKDDGKTVVSSSVIGRQVAFEPVTNDVEAFGQYKLAWTPVGQERKEVDWGASVVRPASENDSALESFSLFILRSPFSGILRTFTPVNYTPGEATYPIDSTKISGFNSKQTLCLNSPDFTTFQRLGVIIQPGATSQSGIELLGEGSGC